MATYGSTLGEYANMLYDKAYSGYLSPAQLNALIRGSFYDIAERKYQQLSTEKTYDELTGFLKVNQEIAINNSLLHTAPIQIINVTAAGSNPITVTVETNKPHYMVPGQIMTTSGIQSFTPSLDGQFTVVLVGTTTFTYAVSGGPAVGVYVPNTGIVTPANSAPQYFHYLRSKVYLLATAVSISAVTTGATTTVTTSSYHNLRTGDSVLIASVGGVTGINQQHDNIVVLNKTKFQIGTTSGTYTSGGTSQLVYYNEATMRRSINKGFYAAQPSNDFPTFEHGENKIFFLPASTKVTIDYMTELPFEIDVNNSTIDLEIYYNPKFLYHLVDEIVYRFAGFSKDAELRATAIQDLTLND